MDEGREGVKEGGERERENEGWKDCHRERTEQGLKGGKANPSEEQL
jgi:hypothetical protein